MMLVLKSFEILDLRMISLKPLPQQMNKWTCKGKYYPVHKLLIFLIVTYCINIELFLL
jgi:hypothetical protein